MIEDLRRRFRELHESGTFVIPNPWDVGSARLLEAAGFEALATTSSGFAASMGRGDQRVDLEELVDHVAAITAVVQIPVSVDAEFGYASDLAGLITTVRRLADAGAAGLSIEDYDPERGQVITTAAAAERIATAAEVAHAEGLVLTGRAENLLYGHDDLDDTTARLRAYRDAGADVLYAPGLKDLDVIARVVREVDAPVNVLAVRGAPTVPELASVGVRRISTGGTLAWTAYGALAEAAAELLGPGSYGYLGRTLDADRRSVAFPPAP